MNDDDAMRAATRLSSSHRRGFTAALVALIAGAACRRRPEPTLQRVAKLGHDPWVLWPSGAAPAGGFPAIVYLHGQGEAAWVIDAQEREVEQGPDSVLAHGAPPALHRARDPRVRSLWENFVVIAPQAENDAGNVRDWSWKDEGVKRKAVAHLEQVLNTGKLNRERVYLTGFSRGGLGCYQLDSDAAPLSFRKIVSVDAQSLEGLTGVAQRGREVRAYYARSTFEDILARHVTAEKTYGARKPPISFIATDVKGKDGEAHGAVCARVFADDELYRWLLG